MPYVYSTQTCSTNYVEYAPSDPKCDGHSVITRGVTIKGGHGVADKKTVVTACGVVTKVSDDDLEFLLRNKEFNLHVEKGFITYDKAKVDAAKRAGNMNSNDRSAPLTSKDFKEAKDSTAESRIYSGRPPK